MIPRLALALPALAIAAWLAIGYYDANREQRGLRLSKTEAAVRDEGVAREADGLLRDAETLNPDPTPKVERATLAIRRHRYEEAIAILRPVVLDEPRNFDAWILLANAAGEAGQGGLLARALLRSRQLAGRD